MNFDAFTPTSPVEAAALVIATEQWTPRHPLEHPQVLDHHIELARTVLDAAAVFSGRPEQRQVDGRTTKELMAEAYSDASDGWGFNSQRDAFEVGYVDGYAQALKDAAARIERT